MTVLQMTALLFSAAMATVVVLARDPRRQTILYMMYGLLLTTLFVLLQAPDVALSELAVGSVAIPFAVLATLVRVGHGRPR